MYQDLVDKYGEDKEKLFFIWKGCCLFYFDVNINLIDGQQDKIYSPQGRVLGVKMNKGLASTDPHYMKGVEHGFEIGKGNPNTSFAIEANKLYQEGVAYGIQCMEQMLAALEEEAQLLEKEFLEIRRQTSDKLATDLNSSER